MERGGVRWRKKSKEDAATVDYILFWESCHVCCKLLSVREPPIENSSIGFRFRRRCTRAQWKAEESQKCALV